MFLGVCGVEWGAPGCIETAMVHSAESHTHTVSLPTCHTCRLSHFALVTPPVCRTSHASLSPTVTRSLSNEQTLHQRLTGLSAQVKQAETEVSVWARRAEESPPASLARTMEREFRNEAQRTQASLP